MTSEVISEKAPDCLSNAATQGKRTITLFVSYARRDNKNKQVDNFLASLRDHLGASKKYYYKCWGDWEVVLGEDWHDKIQEALAACDFGLMLVSLPFINSDYISRHELPKLLERALPICFLHFEWQHYDMKGLEEKQIFRYKDVGFDRCKGEQRKKFIDHLFQDIEKRIDKMLSDAPPQEKNTPYSLIPPKPSWADAIGRDNNGLYADLNIKGITQRLRWIEAGTFLMGPPASEVERYPDEGLSHLVTIADGFWLADTTVTQALWEAIMGNNPSRFAGNPEHPVEQVSWCDAQSFIKRLNSHLPHLKATLPTQVQWEYACRAGTNTAFSFGENITHEQANYNGKHPYLGEAVGLFRQKTVPVKSLPANPWGLYEMHGNVWEWCRDVWREKSARVIRGGSWDVHARSIRSAHRYWFMPDNRSGSIGIRLVVNPSANQKYVYFVDDERNYLNFVRTHFPGWDAEAEMNDQVMDYCGAGATETFVQELVNGHIETWENTRFLLDARMPVPHQLLAMTALWEKYSGQEKDSVCGLAIAAYLRDHFQVKPEYIRIFTVYPEVVNQYAEAFGIVSSMVWKKNESASIQESLKSWGRSI